MTYQTLQQYQNITNSSDLGTVFYYTNSVVNFVSIVILFPLFMIILLSTMFGTKRMTGRFDFFASLTVASFVTTIGAIILSLTTPPLVSLSTLIICISIFIISIIILFMTRD